MANSDKNILITPNTGSSTLTPTIVFRGANNTPVTLRTLDTGTISFEGTAGQLFSISDGLSGSIFSVNDISGIPSVEILDTGLVKLNQYGGSTVFGSATAIQTSSVNAKVSISTASAATPGLIIKGVSSQTANLTEWQDSTGASRTAIQASGSFLSNHSATLTNAGAGGGNAIFTRTLYANAVPVVVRGFTSQTANLQEWQNSSGTVLAAIGPNGTVYMGSDGGANIANFYNGTNGYGAGSIASTGMFNINGANMGFPYTASGATLSVNAQSANQLGLTVRGYASQAYNLQEWQDSAGTSQLSVSATGDLISSGNRSIRFAYHQNVGGTGAYIDFTQTANTLSISQRVTSAVGLIVRGAASQTADLQQWQNSAGTVLARVSSDGKLVVANDGEIPSSLILTSLASPSITTTSTANSYGFTISGSGASTGSNVGISFAAWGGLGFNGVAVPGAAVWFTRTGGYSQGYLSFLTRTGGAEASPLAERMRVGETGTITVAGFTAASTGLIVKAAESQTANLQEWQNSAGTVLARVGASGLLSVGNTTGTIQITSSGTSGSYPSSGAGIELVAGAATATDLIQAYNRGTNAWRNLEIRTGKTSFLSQFASSTVLVVKGYASQTANLTEWQDSAGTVNAKIASNGDFTNNGIFTVYGRFGGASFTDAAALRVNGYSTSVATAIIKSAASQTANLQEWQSSAGTVLSRVQSDGTIRALSLNTSSYISDEEGTRPYINFTVPNKLIINTRDAAYVGLTIKGEASQTANLQEWQNSAGSVVASMSPAGVLTSDHLKASVLFTNYIVERYSDTGPYIQFTTTNILLANRNTASNIVFTVKGMASQTGDLQQWQDSAGTSLARVTKDGDIYSGGLVSTGMTSGYNGADNVLTNLGIQASSWGLSYFRVKSGQAGATVALIDGTASQTGDLTQWRNSAGSVLASISSAGKITSAVDASINGVVIGMGAGSAPTNTVTGLNSLISNTTGTYNTAFGNQSLQLNTSGTQNTAFGHGALYNNRTGWYNTAFGQGALQQNNYAYSNTAIGAQALVTNVSGGNNTALGIQSLLSNLSGNNNIGLGSNAGFSNSTGSGNIFLGNDSGYYETGSNKLYIANTSTTTPLIGGDFSAKTLTVAGNATITSQATGTVGLIVKAIASQTANVFEVQNSSGSAQLAVSQYGVTRALASAYITTNSAASVVLYVDGVASQTANLQEWRNSAGTVLNKIDANGGVNLASGSVDIREGSGNFTIRNAGTTAYFVNASLLVGTGYSAGIGVIIRGNGSQTANLQEWQTSAGTVIGSMSSTGTINSTNLGTLNNWVYAKEESSGGQLRLKKMTAAAANNRASDFAQIYLRDGTNAGTLKLVIIAGASGAETTILDNIPQS